MSVASTSGGLAPSVDVGAWAAALGLAAIHLFGRRLGGVDLIPRSPLLSLAGGSSVAYVFVHALPELAAAGPTLERRIEPLAFVEHHVYLVALAGFLAYYGLERFVDHRGSRDGGGTPSEGTFWVHVGAFAAYNALIGYLLFHPEAPGIGGLLFFAVAMGLHLFVNDHGLRQHHAGAYRRLGRWVLAGAVVVGGLVGATVSIERAAIGALFAFLAGGVVLNVVKEELPPERESRFSAFAVGAVGYAALLLAA